MSIRKWGLSVFMLIAILAVWSCSAGLNMTPYIYLENSTIDFGNTTVSSTKSQSFKIFNHNSESLTLKNIEIVDYFANAAGTEFELMHIYDDQMQSLVNTDAVKIKGFSEITIEIDFKPEIAEKIEAKLCFDHNDKKLETPMTIQLVGTGVESVLKFNPESIDFGSTIIGVQKMVVLLIQNTSQNDVEINHFDFDPSNSEIRIESIKNSQLTDLPDTEPISLTSGDHIILEISFEPVEEKESLIDFIVEFTENNEQFQAVTTIKGTGVANHVPVVEYIDTDPVKVGDYAVIKAKATDPDGMDDIVNVSCSLNLNSIVVVGLSDSGTNGDEQADDGIFTGEVFIPNIPSLYGYIDVTVSASDKAQAIGALANFQLIYTGNLIEVGQGKLFTTIQPAVDAAINGDCVLVHDGNYNSSGDTVEENRNIVFNGKRVILASKNGIDNTSITIDGAAGNFHRAFNCLNNETLDTIVDGFTIKAGFMRHEYGGGAVVCVDAAITMLNCLFKENVGTCDSNGFAYGGVISAINSRLVVKKCKFLNNSAFV